LGFRERGKVYTFVNETNGGELQRPARKEKEREKRNVPCAGDSRMGSRGEDPFEFRAIGHDRGFYSMPGKRPCVKLGDPRRHGGAGDGFCD